MKKVVIIGVVIAVVVAIGGFYAIRSKQDTLSYSKEELVTKTNDDRNRPVAEANDSNTELKALDACEIFTLESAKQIWG